MGLLVDGVWHDQWYDTKKSKGRFIRSEAQFRNWVTADGAAGPTGEAGFKAEPGPLSALCVAGLPLGAPDADLPQASSSLKDCHRCVSVVHHF
jgi:glutathionyl-hydroquinone reductase